MPRTIGPGVHDDRVVLEGRHPAGVEAVAAAVLARRREEAAVASARAGPAASSPRPPWGSPRRGRTTSRPASSRRPTGSSVGGATRVTSAPRVRSSSALERATRLCSTSPTIATRRPSRPPGLDSPRCFHIVNASSSAWVGCSWVPSPALTTLDRTQPEWASRCGAPLAPWRTTTASAPIASSVSAVSLRLSPLLRLEPLAEKLMTSALSRLAAASNEIRVRVESSKNRLTTVRPRSAGSFLIGRSASERISSAVVRTSSASSRVRSAALSRCRFTPAPLLDRDRVDAVGLGDAEP